MQSLGCGQMENEHFNQFGQKWHHLVTILVNIVKLMHLHDTCHNKVKDLEFLINKELVATPPQVLQRFFSCYEDLFGVWYVLYWDAGFSPGFQASGF